MPSRMLCQSTTQLAVFEIDMRMPERILKNSVLENTRTEAATRNPIMKRGVTAFLAIAVIAIIGSRFQPLADLVAQEPAVDAAKIADEWWYSGDGKSRSGESSHRIGAGPKDGTFYALTGTVQNLGSYADVWNFYAKKCVAEESWSDSRQIIGKPSKTGGYYTIFQRNDGGRNTTTFASHEKDATITVHVHEAEATPDKTVLQLSVVVARH